MEKGNSEDIQKKVAALLASKRLKEAIDTLSVETEDLQDWSLRTRFTQMKDSYTYLLEYLRNGTPDPGRDKMHSKLIGECYILNDQIAIAKKGEQITSAKRHSIDDLAILHNKLRENSANIEVTKLLSQADEKSIKATLCEEHENLLNDAFSTIVHSTHWSKSNSEEIVAMTDDEELPINDRATLTSAITLSLIKCFEPIKAIALIRATWSRETAISIRATIGYIIGIFVYDDRMEYYPEVIAATKSLLDSPTILARIATTQIQLLRCRETQKIDRKMREEIIPAMMKNPHLNSDKIGMDIMREIEQEEDKNPEWKAWSENGDIKNKLEEIAQWQIEGADVYMSTFSQLKNYPFFNKEMNWLRPFDASVPAIADIIPENSGEQKTILSTICSSHFFCNSDKYSFCLTFNHIPQQQRDMLLQQISDGDNGDEENPKAPTDVEPEKRAEAEGNQYIQDLYRYFRLSRAGKNFNDPFRLSLNLLNSKSLSILINDDDTLLRVFNYLVEKGYYSEAIETGYLYETGNAPDAQFYQEMGYCLQKEKEYRAAINYYTRADIIKPDTLWTLLHIAQCHRMAGNADKAIGFYLMAEEIAPDNIPLLRQTGECFALLKRYDEAFARFFKLEYIKPGSTNTLRAIAWCSFLTAKDAQARDYYRRIMKSEKAKFTDYMNAAHVEWTSHNNAEAIELYTRAKELCSNKELFIEHLEKDFATLAERGVKKNELLLLRDLIV